MKKKKSNIKDRKAFKRACKKAKPRDWEGR